jgi:cytochrome c oxidase subunit 2
MSDWYLARQLRNFQQGIRGTHPQDFSGAQMVLMAKILPDERAIDDLLAYVHTLDARAAGPDPLPSRAALERAELPRRGM